MDGKNFLKFFRCLSLYLFYCARVKYGYDTWRLCIIRRSDENCNMFKIIIFLWQQINKRNYYFYQISSTSISSSIHFFRFNFIGSFVPLFKHFKLWGLSHNQKLIVLRSDNNVYPNLIRYWKPSSWIYNITSIQCFSWWLERVRCFSFSILALILTYRKILKLIPISVLFSCEVNAVLNRSLSFAISYFSHNTRILHILWLG